MAEIKTYKITYSQRFDGDVLTDSYNRTVSNMRELFEIEQALYDDPHVFSVGWEALSDDEATEA